MALVAVIQKLFRTSTYQLAQMVYHLNQLGLYFGSWQLLRLRWIFQQGIITLLRNRWLQLC